VLGVNVVPTNLNNACQKVLMNLLSLSLIMVLGRSCNLKTSLKNSSATCVVLKSVAMEKKCENFSNLSTTKKMHSFPYSLGKMMMNPWICFPTCSLEWARVATILLGECAHPSSLGM
jgi:hypothetical protein